MSSLSTWLRRVCRGLVSQRVLLGCLVSAVVGIYGWWCHPLPSDDPVMVLVTVHTPGLATAITSTYYVLWFSTAFWVCQLVCSLLFIFADPAAPVRARALPPYPAIHTRRSLFVVLGELHERVDPVPSPTPIWQSIPARGCYGGIAVLGATGSGKTAGVLYPLANQLLGYAADDPARKVSALLLEVKGDFCKHLHGILRRHGREADYVELNLSGAWRYNPLHQPDLDAYAVAYSMASLMTQVWGKSKEPFWQLAATNLVQFLILLHLVVEDYVTFLDVYECAISADRLEARMREAKALPWLQSGVITIPIATHAAAREATQARARWEPHSAGTMMRTEATPWTLSALNAAGISYELDTPKREERKYVQWQAVRLWYEQDWLNLDTKLRTAIVEGLSSFIAVFNADPDLRHTFCPPRESYRTRQGAGSGRVLAPFQELIEQGAVVAVNFPVAANPAVARVVCTMAKMDCQRAILRRIPKIEANPDAVWRAVVLMFDEYHQFATAGAEHPGGDEQFFSLDRQARCIPIISTQGISSLAATLPADTWRPLLAQFRTKILLTQTDDMTAQWASDMCGRVDRLKQSFNVSEVGRDASVSLLTGRTVATSASLGTTTTYTWQREPLFESRVFTELRNMEAIVMAYDGINPIPPQRLYLKPYYASTDRTHFQHLEAGEL
jgi:hypothetical protein